eukprot:gene5521-3505_t
MQEDLVDRREVDVHVDGSSDRENCRAGWGVAVFSKGELISQYWGPVCIDKTSPTYRGVDSFNIGAAEVQALLEGLCVVPLLPRHTQVRIHVDSTYSKGVVEGTKKAHANLAVVDAARAALRALEAAGRRVQLVKVPRSHAQQKAADRLARHGAGAHVVDLPPHGHVGHHPPSGWPLLLPRATAAIPSPSALAATSPPAPPQDTSSFCGTLRKGTPCEAFFAADGMWYPARAHRRVGAKWIVHYYEEGDVHSEPLGPSELREPRAGAAPPVPAEADPAAMVEDAPDAAAAPGACAPARCA